MHPILRRLLIALTTAFFTGAVISAHFGHGMNALLLTIWGVLAIRRLDRDDETAAAAAPRPTDPNGG